MGQINLSNEKGRDAVVQTESVSTPLRVRWVDPRGRQAQSVRVLRGTRDGEVEALLAKHGDLAGVSKALVDADPELDLERVGTLLRESARVYVDPEGKIVHAIQEIEVVRGPDGAEKERRPRVASIGNVATETPLKWSGRLLKKSEAIRRFVMSRKQQITHVNGLTYDFLFSMAQELEKKEALMLLMAGPKSNQRLVFQRSGTPYFGFLEGRTQGDKYQLILHLSNLELKAPPKPDAAPLKEGEA